MPTAANPSPAWTATGLGPVGRLQPDGTRVVTASDDKTARVWDAARGKPIGRLQGHGDRVNSAAFTPDGTRVVTASEDKTARVWDAATGRPSRCWRAMRVGSTRPRSAPTGRGW